jgi:hypothetical protein
MKSMLDRLLRPRWFSPFATISRYPRQSNIFARQQKCVVRQVGVPAPTEYPHKSGSWPSRTSDRMAASAGQGVCLGDRSQTNVETGATFDGSRESSVAWELKNRRISNPL